MFNFGTWYHSNKKKVTNYQDFLKVIAIVTMFIDHLGLYFFPKYYSLRIIGRLSMPIFCFFAGYNFHGFPRHSIIIFALASQAITIGIFQHILLLNMLFSIYFGQWYIYFITKFLHLKIENLVLTITQIILLSILCIFNYKIFDYGTFGIAIMLAGYAARQIPKQLKLFAAVSCALSCIYTFSIFSFASNYSIAIIALSISTYILLIAYDFKKIINYNLAILSRNSLIFYFLHVAVMQITLYCIYYVF